MPWTRVSILPSGLTLLQVDSAPDGDGLFIQAFDTTGQDHLLCSYASIPQTPYWKLNQCKSTGIRLFATAPLSFFAKDDLVLTIAQRAVHSADGGKTFSTILQAGSGQELMGLLTINASTALAILHDSTANTFLFRFTTDNGSNWTNL